MQNTRGDLATLDRLRNRTLNTLPPADLLEGTPIFSEGRIQSAGTSTNYIFNRNISFTAGYVYSDAKNTNPAFAGKTIPYIPRERINLVATWTNNNRFYISTQAIYRTHRYIDEANLVPLASSWDALTRAYWESSNKKWVIEAYAANLLRKNAENLYGLNLAWRF